MKKRTGLIVFFITALCGIVVLSVAARFRTKRKALLPGTIADYVLIEKRAHRLTLYYQHRRLRSYRVALGRGGLKPKIGAGDARTPEGLYKIESHLAKTKYPHALKLSYPSERDKAMARRRGTRADADVLIHGMRNGLSWIGGWHRLADWTSGSVAVTDEEMAEIYHVVPNETPVEIRG